MHIFDLTTQVKLSPRDQKIYNWLRGLLHIAFIVMAVFAADRILLPNASQDFFFDAAVGSTKNTLSDPRIQSQPSNGNVNANQTLTFNSSRMGIFSTATTTFVMDDKMKDFSKANVSIHKSYQAFFFPTGEPMGFKNGSLLTTDEGEYFIVSGDLLRKFTNTNIILTLGYPKSSFQLIDSKDLQYNKVGPEISSPNTYPDGTLFSIDETFYQLLDQQLLPFISTRAFLSQYEAIQAIPKNKDLFSTYPKSENSLGFSDGTLASADISVYILSKGKSYPVANAETFLSMGFNWDDIIPLASEELGFYEKQKQFNQNQPHPDGTVFRDQKTNEYFVVDKGTKRPIKSAAILKNYEKQKPIAASLEGLNKSVSCTLSSPLLTRNTYSCAASLQEINQFPGNYYRIDTVFPETVKVVRMNETLSTPFTWQNIHNALGGIKNTLLINYSIQQ